MDTASSLRRWSNHYAQTAVERVLMENGLNVLILSQNLAGPQSLSNPNHRYTQIRKEDKKEGRKTEGRKEDGRKTEGSEPRGACLAYLALSISRILEFVWNNYPH